MPIHKDFHPMLDGMTEEYCTGESEETGKTESAEGYPKKTCRKALSVFYATCKEKGLDHSKPMPIREHVTALLPFKILEKIVDKPLKIRVLAMTAGMSRNFNIYTPEELQAFTSKLVSAPVYLEHVSAMNAVGKVTKTDWDPESKTLFCDAEIYDDETQKKIHKGLIQHVSVAADYEHIDVLDGKVPHGLHNAELSLVAVPGIPETNIHIMESLSAVDNSASPTSSNPIKEVENMGEEQNQGEGIKPQEGEEHQDFMKRCLATGKEMEQCTNIWKQYHPKEEPQGEPAEPKTAEQAEQEEPKGIEFEVSEEPTMNELISSVKEVVGQINNALEALAKRVAALEQGQGGSVTEFKGKGQGIVVPGTDEDKTSDDFAKMSLREVMKPFS